MHDNRNEIAMCATRKASSSIPPWAERGATPSTMSIMGVREADKFVGWTARDLVRLELNEKVSALKKL